MGLGVELDCLEGIRVVDFTQFEAGPSCTESLAWLGAEVVKIENPGLGDPGRRRQKGKPGREGAQTFTDNDPWYFHQFNANKKSVTLNLKSPHGLEIVRELLKKADVMVENMAPGTIERLGLVLRRGEEDQPRHHLLPDQGIRHRQPLREEPRLRHDRAGRRRHDQHHRLCRPPAGEARHLVRRHRHRHADGDQHSRRAVQASKDRRGPPPAGRHAGRHGPLHARAVLAHAGHGQGRAARRHRSVRCRAASSPTRSIRASQAGRTTTSTCSAAAPIPSTGNGC